MAIHKHPSFFPVVLAVLTVALGAVIYTSVHSGGNATVPATETTAVDPDQYRAAVRAALAPVLVPDGKDRAGDVTRAIDALLPLRVPTADMKAHLELVGGLSQVRAGLTGDTAALKAGQARLDTAVAAFPWVR